MLHLTSHVFSTYTYTRDIPADQIWGKVAIDFNRYIQRLRRLHPCSVHYLRTVESHQDYYPHLHAILQFGSPITVKNVRYFDNDLYAKWKSLWPCGISDYQPPLNTRKLPILYIIKYISKSHTTKTIWKKLYADISCIASEKSHSQTTMKPTVSNAEQSSLLNNPTSFFCKKYKIKQCTWSRGFKFPKMTMLSPPPAGQTLLTQRTK